MKTAENRHLWYTKSAHAKTTDGARKLSDWLGNNCSESEVYQKSSDIRRPCSDFCQVTTPYKLSYIIIIFYTPGSTETRG